MNENQEKMLKKIMKDIKSLELNELRREMKKDGLTEAKNNFMKMYPNSTDLEQDIVAWYRSLKKDIGEKYAKEMRADLVKALMKESKLTEALARGLKPLLKLGSTITKKVGEDALMKLSDKFDRIDDEDADNIASHLNMAIELMQDGYPGDATKMLKQFNKKCKEVLKGKSVGSVFEGKLNEGFATWELQFAPMNLGGVDLDPKKKYKVKARSTVEAIKKASKMAGLSGDHWMATQTHKLTKIG